MSIMSGRISKWILALSEFDLRYESAKAVNGQIMADFVTQHCDVVHTLEIVPWTLFFDGSTCDRGAGIDIILISPRGKKYEFSLPIVATSTNNQAEYQALIKGLELLKEVHADVIEIFGDSMLVINQLAGIYECQSELLITYYERRIQLLREFKDFRLEYIPRLHNEEANRLAQHASGYQPIVNVSSADNTDDWRKENIDYLKNRLRGLRDVLGFKLPSMYSLEKNYIIER